MGGHVFREIDMLNGLWLGFFLIAALTVMYIVLGTALDGISMIVLTTAIVIPMVKQAGFDLVWFGIFLVTAIAINLVGVLFNIIFGTIGGWIGGALISLGAPFVFRASVLELEPRPVGCAVAARLVSVAHHRDPDEVGHVGVRITVGEVIDERALHVDDLAAPRPRRPAALQHDRVAREEQRSLAIAGGPERTDRAPDVLQDVPLQSALEGQ